MEKYRIARICAPSQYIKKWFGPMTFTITLEKIQILWSKAKMRIDLVHILNRVWVRSKEDILIINPFIPSNTILRPKVNLAKILSEKSWSVKTLLNLSML